MPKKDARRLAAIGFRAHSGWAAAVVVSGRLASPLVVDRRRIQIANARIPGSKQPFHAAEGLPFKEVQRLIQRCTASAHALARQALRALLDDLTEKGYRAVGCGLLLTSGRPLPELARILAPHTLIHTAEGEMFREAIVGQASAVA